MGGCVVHNKRKTHVNITSDYAAKQVQKLWDRLDQPLHVMEEEEVKKSISRWLCHEKALKAAGV